MPDKTVNLSDFGSSMTQHFIRCFKIDRDRFEAHGWEGERRGETKHTMVKESILWTTNLHIYSV